MQWQDCQGPAWELTKIKAVLSHSQVQRPNTTLVTLTPPFPKDNMFAERKQWYNL